MTDYSNWKILKTEFDKHAEEYSQVADWCNNFNQYTIIDDGIYYKVVPIEEPSIDERKEEVREYRNRLLQEYDFTQLNDAPFTEQEKESYAQYRQYLRDYTLIDNWWEQNPLTYEEWITNNI